MTKRRRIYEGKAKILYDGPEAGTLIQHFKDDLTANNNEKQAVIKGKGVLNNRISEHFFTLLNDLGIPTHFLKRVNMREQLVRAVQIIPLEVVVRNYAAGSICRRLGLEEGMRLPRAIVELYYKDDKLGDPMVSEEHVAAFGWTSVQEFDEITALAVRVNDILSGLIAGAGIRLVDLKMEFGRVFEGENTQIVIADEISPDTCRLWDIQTKKKLDKDRFRNDLGDVIDAYREVAHRLNIIPRAEQTNIQPLTSPRIVK